MERDDIIIRNAIVHILDSTIGMPVFSDQFLELGPDLNDFLRGHIYKIAVSDDKKNCRFNDEEGFLFKCMKSFTEDNMISASQEIAGNLYTIMNQNITIPPGDFFAVTYQTGSSLYLALLKMNYKETYIHYAYSQEGMNYNDIIKQKVTLPSEGARLSEAVLINLQDFTLELVERKYDINGVKANYLSTLFLQCDTELSQKSKLNIITKAVEQVQEKYFGNDFDKAMEIKSVIHEEYTNQGTISAESVGEKLFGEQAEIKEEFSEKLKKYNLETEEVKPVNKQTTKKFEKQYLTTDTGIEINIPMDQYNDKNNVEFINNPDGTISVLIKNISSITSK